MSFGFDSQQINMRRVLFLLLCFIGLLSSNLCCGHASNGRGDQPLAQINIYKASLALDTSVHIHASPQVLGLKVLFLSGSCLILLFICIYNNYYILKEKKKRFLMLDFCMIIRD